MPTPAPHPGLRPSSQQLPPGQWSGAAVLLLLQPSASAPGSWGPNYQCCWMQGWGRRTCLLDTAPVLSAAQVRKLEAEKRSQEAGRALPGSWRLLPPQAAWASLRGLEVSAGSLRLAVPMQRHLSATSPSCRAATAIPRVGEPGPTPGVSWQWTAALGTWGRPGLPFYPMASSGAWPGRAVGPA